MKRQERRKTASLFLRCSFAQFNQLKLILTELTLLPIAWIQVSLCLLCIRILWLGRQTPTNITNHLLPLNPSHALVLISSHKYVLGLRSPCTSCQFVNVQCSLVCEQTLLEEATQYINLSMFWVPLQVNTEQRPLLFFY